MAYTDQRPARTAAEDHAAPSVLTLIPGPFVFTNKQSRKRMPSPPDLERLARAPARRDDAAWAVAVRAPAGAGYLRLKRLLDVGVAGAGLIVLSLVLLLIAAVIAAESGGPVFFHQMRVGKNGRWFRFYKFRSMVREAEAIKTHLTRHNEADGPIFKMRDDPRVTRVGKFLRRYSLDELPQLVNVLRGEMSLVGPRPHLPDEVEKYTERQKARLRVQPGLLCLREVFGRSHLTFERWIDLDLMYIEYRSLAMDLRILLRTLPAVFKGDGAY